MERSKSSVESRETVRTQKRYDRQAETYDITEAPAEFLMLGRLRRRFWRGAPARESGLLLEVGVGTGKNLPHHPRTTRAVAIDLSPRMVRRARERAARLGRDVEFVVADAQHLPFRDGVFDAAAATFVFCSVPDPVAGLTEVARVTRGDIRLLEHVRSGNPLAGKVMDLLNPLVVRISGANINRDTVTNVKKAGIRIEALDSRGFGIVKLISGRRSDAADQTGLEADDERTDEIRNIKAADHPL